MDCDGGAPFPPDDDRVDEVHWYDPERDDGDSLTLRPSATSVSLPDAELSVVLANDTDRTFETNFYDWALYRLGDDRWHRVAPESWPTPLMTLGPGDAHTWTLRLDHGDRSDPFVRTEGTAELDLTAIGAGTYAFAVRGRWENRERAPERQRETVRAARFEVQGDPLPLVPSRAVTEVRRDGDVAVVSAPHPLAAELDGLRAAALTLRRDDGAPDPEALVTEQVYRRWPLRDALSHVEPGVEAVRVESATPERPPFWILDDELPIRYEGRTYRVSATATDE